MVIVQSLGDVRVEATRSQDAVGTECLLVLCFFDNGCADAELPCLLRCLVRALGTRVIILSASDDSRSD